MEPEGSLDVSHGAPGNVAEVTMLGRIRAALGRARARAASLQRADGGWVGEVELNPGPTAQAVILHHALRITFPESLAPKARRYLLRLQQGDGGWGGTEHGPADASVTGECYVGLRLLGLGPNEESCVRARNVLERLGGIAKMNPWTQLYLAVLGVVPWELLPKIPVEIALLPGWSPLAIENFAYWVKVITTPMMLLHAVGPGEPVPQAPSIAAELGVSRLKRLAVTDSTLERLLAGVLKTVATYPVPRFRKRAIAAALGKIEAFTEANGDFGGNTCTAINVLVALDRMGLRREPRFERGLEALMRYGYDTGEEWHLQTCQSHVWDTAFTMAALEPGDAAAAAGARWLLDRQILGTPSYWSRNVDALPGGWCFGERHEHFPVTDCTAVALLGLCRHSPGFAQSESARRGVEWLLGMQGPGGGWSAYERYEGGHWLNRFLAFKDIPDALSDLPKADVSAKVVEALCELRAVSPAVGPALTRARNYLLASRTPELLWKGNYGVNYLYGTTFAARALHAIDGESSTREEWARPAREFFLQSQNVDGGWGESDRSYSDPSRRGRGDSTVIQTCWALLGLCASAGKAASVRESECAQAILRGASHLMERQGESGAWVEEQFLGTVFPEKVYFRYHLYPVYFPVLALAEAERALAVLRDPESLRSEGVRPRP